MRILAGIDEYEESRSTVQAAARLSEKLGAEASLLHVMPASRPAMLEVELEDLAAVRDKAVAEVAASMQKSLAGMLAGTSWEGRDPAELLTVLPGQPARVIAAEAERQGADWVLLGPHRKHGLLDFGNTLRACVALTHGSIWMQVGAWKDPQRIVAPIDLSEISSEVLQSARDLALAFGASVRVLHCFAEPMFGYPGTLAEPVAMPTYVIEGVRDSSRQRAEELVGRVDWKGVSHDLEIVDASPIEAIREAQEQADLVVLGQHGEGWLSATVLGSTAYAVLKSARGPVLAHRHHG